MIARINGESPRNPSPGSDDLPGLTRGPSTVYVVRLRWNRDGEVSHGWKDPEELQGGSGVAAGMGGGVARVRGCNAGMAVASAALMT